MRAPGGSEKARRAGRSRGVFWFVSASAAVAMAIALSIHPFTRRLDAPVVRPEIKRLVVLPFENRTGDDANAFLAAGLGEELSSELGKIGSLSVLAHSAARYAVRRSDSPLDAALALGADAAIEGFVSRVDDRMHVRVVLIRLDSQEQLWSDQYGLAGGDGLSLQSRWALRVAKAVDTTIEPEELRVLERARPTDADAESAFLSGQLHWSLRTRDGFVRALGDYQRAIQLDPTYADAYGAMAAAWSMMADYAIQDPATACARAAEYARTALEFDDSVIEARMALGFCTYLIDRDYLSALREFEQIERIEPSNANAVYWHSMVQFRLGNFEEALEISGLALKLDPTYSLYLSGHAAMMLGARRDREALDFTADAVEAFPDDLFVLGMHAAALLRNGRTDEARAVLDSRSDNIPPYAFWLMRYGAYRAMAGQPDQAREALAQLRSEPGYKDAAAEAAILAALGEIDNAFSAIEVAFAAKSALLTSIVWDPAWDTLRTDPRYIDLLLRSGLQDFADQERARLSAPDSAR